jgi:hypothetical protein
LHANQRRRRNHIGTLEVNGATLVTEEEKAEAAFHYFSGILGTAHDREGRLDFEALGIHRRDLSSLGRPFTEEEIWAVVKELPLDKAPGPDGFTGHFYLSAWSIIKRDVIRAFNPLSSMDCRSFHHLNDALLILLPKSLDPVSLGDYRPISLIHSFGKKFSKALSNHFASVLPLLVSPNLSAFIKGRQIHDNFRCVLGTAKILAAKRNP